MGLVDSLATQTVSGFVDFEDKVGCGDVPLNIAYKVLLDVIDVYKFEQGKDYYFETKLYEHLGEYTLLTLTMVSTKVMLYFLLKLKDSEKISEHSLEFIDSYLRRTIHHLCEANKVTIIRKII